MYIIWNKNINESFRISYFLEVGENIQNNPHETETQYMVGSSRITQKNMDELKGIYNEEIDFSINYPNDFIIDTE